jgi:V8-like Glu-specific endopeptidase
MPEPKDQYKVTLTSVVHRNQGIGGDWAIFVVEPNSETGQRPLAAQGGRFFQLSDSDQPTQVRVTGYGIDQTPPGSTGRRNSQNKTLQTANGAFKAFHQSGNRVFMRYLADTEPANSGSPVIALDAQGQDTDSAIGIHTNGGCTRRGNRGTSFKNRELMKAINDFRP